MIFIITINVLFLVCQHTWTIETTKQLHTNTPLSASSTRSWKSSPSSHVSRPSPADPRSAPYKTRITYAYDAKHS